MYIYIMYIYVYNRHGLHIYIYKYIHTQKYWSLLRVRKICSQKIIISSLRFKFDLFFFIVFYGWFRVVVACTFILLAVFTYVFHLCVA